MLGAVVLLTAGCAVDQKKEVQTYRQVLDANQTQETTAFDPNAPLSLQQALVVASAHNQHLALAGEDYLQALIDQDRAFARFLPTIGLAPAYMRQEKTSIGAGNPLFDQFMPEETLDVPIKGRMTLAPMTDVPARHAAVATAAGQRAMLLEHRAVVLLDVAQTYYQVLSCESEVEGWSYTLEVQEQRLDETRTRQAAGVARPLDVSQAEAAVAATRATLIQAQNDVKNGRAMLALLLGVHAVNGPLNDGFVVPGSDWPLETLIQQAETHRQDLVAARAQVKTAAARLEAAWGGYFPSVSLNLGQYLSRERY